MGWKLRLERGIRDTLLIVSFRAQRIENDSFYENSVLRIRSWLWRSVVLSFTEELEASTFEINAAENVTTSPRLDIATFQ